MSFLVGRDETNLTPIFPGWNVWAVDQKIDLDFDPMMVRVSRDRRLKIWVEDSVKRSASVDTGDALLLKGEQVDILGGIPAGLKVAATKENVPGDPMLLDGESNLRVVRFFNRGAPGSISWPHDDDYILDQVYIPDPRVPETSAPPPKTTVQAVVKPIGEGIEDVVKIALGIAAVAIVAAVVVKK